ncbi:molybdopterin-dependent oxidoreductase [Sphingopyxis sp. GW247-27LB]|uniref:molybdopterin-dependent oxidoreductase n=1 Tax=Sphingopyxis sp. GW247-27LB TaxID=2012632 RepID=UPI000BA6F5E9|nr:molybdopterin-dependent oxidoreductase [Sphingopyxis sp. GW247-27LB]PAL22039.1 formate dehydrogenase [Sphingopyxis sp. GW247-27LB]
MRPATGEDGDHVTFCRICTAVCGLVATVEDGKVVRARPDPDNPSSQGHACVKGISYHAVTHDPDRVTRPMKRVAPGRFEPVGWDEALNDIARRLSAIIAEHGPDAVASYQGNPPAYATDGMTGFRMFLKALGTTKIYGAGSQDTNARFTANWVLYGSPLTIDVPDVNNADFMIIFGANPLVSNGSLIFTPRVRHQLDAVAARGGVVVVDPRCSETAARYEHVAIEPNSDCWLMLAMLRTLAEEGLADEAFLAARCAGWPELRAALTGIEFAEAARRTGIGVDAIKALARRLVASPRSVCYGRVGICRGPYATLANFLLSALNMVGGTFGHEGGSTFATPVLAGSDRATTGGYDEVRSRIGNFPSVTQFLPSAVMPDDILEPGPGQVRALLSLGGNVLLAAPGGERLRRGLEQLELSVSFDLYINEAGSYADYVLPGLTFYERADLPMVPFMSMVQPFLQYTEPVIAPVGEARSEFDTFCAILGRMGLRMPAASPEEAAAQAAGGQMRPLEVLDGAIRQGPAGAAGWSIDRLRDHPHGAMLDIPIPWGNPDKIAHADGRIHLWDDLIAGELDRLLATPPAKGLKLLSRRDIRSHNGWLHNVDRLVRSQKPTLHIHPDDAAAHDLADGDRAILSNRFGEIEVEVEVNADHLRGTVSYPHCFGHGSGGWQRANRAGGANINILLGHGPDVVEAVSGTTLMDGISVELRAAQPA